MPSSKHRRKHPHHPKENHPHAESKSKKSAAFFMAVIFGVFGALIALMATGGNIIWMLIGGGVGTIAGYLSGKSIDKTAKKI
jgi:ABC-type dipeptide/oligopeptide/nickel transport system permease subunit